LPAATVGASYIASLASSGGSGNYAYSVSGAPAGLAISGSNLAGTPATAGTYSNVVVTVKDTTSGASAQKTFSLTVYAPVTVSTTGLPNGIVGNTYSASLVATGGSGNYAWSASAAPAGLGISGSTLLGTPTTAAAATVILTVTDTNTALSAQKTLPLTIYSAPAITTSTLPSGTVGVAYSAALTASGGSGNFTWSAAGLPAGIVLSGNTLGGTPTAAGTSSVAITLKDATTGLTAQNTLTLTVASATSPSTSTAPAISTLPLPWGVVGSLYSATLTATGGSGSYSWSASGLPPGITLSGNTLSGKPTTANVYANVAVTVTDNSTALKSSSIFSITIYNALAVTASLPSGIVGSPYSAALAASGGSGNFKWSASGLPPGIAVSGSTLTGTPTTAGSYSSVALIVTDAVTGLTAQKTYSILIRNKAVHKALSGSQLQVTGTTDGSTSGVATQ